MARFLLLYSLLLSPMAFAYDPCVTGETALGLVMLSDGPERRANVRPLQRLLRTVCVSGGNQGFPVYYSNGQVATIALGNPNVAWYYPNGQSATAVSGNENIAFYYPNGRTFSILPGNRLIAWTYPNGQTFSAIPGNTNVSWVWSNGVVLAPVPGVRFVAWHHRSGAVAFAQAPFDVTDSDMEVRPHEVLKQVAERFRDIAR